MAEQEELLTIKEVAKALRCDPTTARRWVVQGMVPCVILPHVRARRVYRVRASTLKSILEGK